MTTTTENIAELSFVSAVKTVALSDLQAAIEKAIEELLHRKLLCNISKLELSLLNGASISLTLKESHEGLKPVDSGQRYVVSGAVTYADSTPAVGLTVIAYDKDVSGKDNLGQPVVTKESGAFAIPYSDADFRRTKEERGGADVIVCIYNAEKELLFTSKKQNNAPANYELNIKLPAQPFR